MNQNYLNELFHWVTERESIREKRKQKMPPPWTTDTVLAQYRFCNVFREFDTVTQWIMREWLQESSPTLAFNTAVGRLVNWPDTLKELRASLPASSAEHLHRFIDMHDLGDALVGAGFSDPVMDMEMITLTYTKLDDLFHDLRVSGSTNAALSRPRGLVGAAGDVYEQHADAVAAADTDSSQPAGHASHLRGQLAVTPHLLAVAHRDRIGGSLGPRFEAKIHCH